MGAVLRHDFNQPLNKLRSFILVSIDSSDATSYRLSIVTFALPTHRLATTHNVTDGDRRTQHSSISETIVKYVISILIR